MSVESSNGYRPIAELPTLDLTEQVDRLDQQTDEIFALRQSLASFYRDFAPALRRVETEIRIKRKKHTMHRPMRMDEIITAIDNGDSLEACIDWDHAQAVLAPQGITGRALYPFMTTALQDAVQTYRRIRELGGLRPRDPQSRAPLPFDASTHPAYAHYAMRAAELESAIPLHHETSSTITQTQADLEQARDITVRTGGRAAILYGQFTQQQLEELTESVEDYWVSNPEGYYYDRMVTLRRYAREMARGELVVTPYVAGKIREVVEVVREQQRPVLIHGDLGSGKTELAKLVAKRYLSDAYIARWEKANMSPLQSWERENRHRVQYRLWTQAEYDSKREQVIRSAQQMWLRDRDLASEPLIISGSGDTDTADLLGTRTLKRGDPLSPGEILSRVMESWEEAKRQMAHINIKLEQLGAVDHHGKALSEEDVDTEIEHIEGLLQGDENQNYIVPIFYQVLAQQLLNPTEIKVYLGPLLRAKKEGRPVIIDEMNAIPHHVKIVLNLYLTTKPGKPIHPPFPEEPPFEVAEGECVIATANLRPEDDVYVDRQPEDPAYVSRFGYVDYDYLPMQETATPTTGDAVELRDHKARNELLHMLGTMVLDKRLMATLPEGAWRDLENLALAARTIQDLFSSISMTDQASTDSSIVENVMSIRHILPIVRAWQSRAFRLPLDYYIYQHYLLRSKMRPTELKTLYQTLRRFGFFSGQSWPDPANLDDVRAGRIQWKGKPTTLTNVMSSPVSVPTTIRTYSTKEVIDELFGPPDKRSLLPTPYWEQVAVQDSQSRQDRQDRVNRLRSRAGGLSGLT